MLERASISIAAAAACILINRAYLLLAVLPPKVLTLGTRLIRTLSHYELKAWVILTEE